MTNIRDEVVQELAIALTKQRGGGGAGPHARRILTHQPDVVGLTDDCQIVHWQRTMWALIAVPVVDTGLNGREGRRIETARQVRQVDAFVDEHSAS